MKPDSTFPRIILAFSVLFLFLTGCQVVVSGGGDNVNDNTNENTNSNADDNVVDNTNDNVDTTNFAVFADPDSDYAATDVHDIDEEVVRFDPLTQSVIWVADGRSFDSGVWSVNGNLLTDGGSFQVRFGTKDGQRRAYFTETAPGTVCNLVVSGENFLIYPTPYFPPQE